MARNDARRQEQQAVEGEGRIVRPDQQNEADRRSERGSGYRHGVRERGALI